MDNKKEITILGTITVNGKSIAYGWDEYKMVYFVRNPNYGDKWNSLAKASNKEHAKRIVEAYHNQGS